MVSQYSIKILIHYIKTLKIGKTSSELYDNVLDIAKNPYFIYENQEDVNPGIFKIDPDINEKEEEIYLSIREVIPVISEYFEKKINPVIDINSGITYKEIEDDIKKDVPYFVVEKYSDMIYLGYLFSTKTRSGTYYETLGYQNLDINYRTIKKKTTTLIEKYKEVPVKEIIKDIQEDVDKVMKKEELYIDDISFIAYHNNILNTMKKYGNKNLPLLEYLNDLVIKDKCNIIQVLIKSELYFNRPNKYTIILKNLYEMANGEYVKYF